MARAADSPTATSVSAGDGREGTTISGGRAVGSAGSLLITWIGALGKSRSTPTVAYVSTSTFPARVAASRYLPRLNPAKGIGRSDIHRDVCCPAALADVSADTCAGFPVATSVHPCG